MTESSISTPLGLISSPATPLYVHYNTSRTSIPAPVAATVTSRTKTFRFAHPAEAEIARLLDFHDVQWQYEPTTFALVTGDKGQPIQSFTPDFYLPDQDVYIEMTTMRQSLVTRKNRKFRLLRELYPELNVKLLYRKDVELIIDRYSRPHDEHEGEAPLHQVIREELILRRVAEMADSLNDGSDRPYCLLALGESAVRTQALVADRLTAAGCSVTTGLLAVNGYRQESAACTVWLEKGFELDLESSDVVVVADIVGTGLTALSAFRLLKSRGVGWVRLISLLDRRSSRLVDVPIIAAGFTATSHWHVGAGLGHCPRLRDLPDIHSLSVRPAI